LSIYSPNSGERHAKVTLHLAKVQYYESDLASTLPRSSVSQ